VLLRRRGWYRPQPGWPRFWLQLAAALAAMGLVLAWLGGSARDWLRIEPIPRIGWLAGLTLAGALAYFAALWVAGLRPREFLRRD
jgi:putative peptidoglycan lipid II flippase